MDTIQLKHPITVDGQEVTEVTLRRPKVRDLKAIEGVKSDMEKSIKLVSNLTQMKPAAVEELDAEDFTAISDQVGKFVGGKAGS